MDADYKLIFYVPNDALESVKSALFSVGAGRVGKYDCCCWQIKGRGQFRPLKGAHPTIGSVYALELVEEWKVEMVLEKDVLIDAVAALKSSHPYETPAYQVIELVNIS